MSLKSFFVIFFCLFADMNYIVQQCLHLYSTVPAVLFCNCGMALRGNGGLVVEK